MAGDELLAGAIDAHGGMARWEAAEEIALDVHSGGFALATKLRRRELPSFEVRVSTREPRVVFDPYPEPGSRGVFAGDSVRIERADGAVASERDDPRRLFRGRRNLWWDPLDLLYFAGYAWWGYANVPFLLARPGFAAREIEPWHEGEETWRRLAVTFPDDLPAHSREQVFHFDADLRLRRNDYTAEVFGGWAKAAHLCSQHREFDGVLFPTRRRVYPRARSGRPRPFPTLVRLDVESARVSGARA